MPPFLRDNPILWHFAPWKSRGARGRLFWMMLLAALALPVLGFWILGEGSPLELLNPGIMKARDGEGFFSIIGQIWNFPVLNIWVWWAVLPGFSIVTAILAVAAIYLLRLDLLRMGLLEQVYLTGLDRNRAALGTVAWGGLVALIILASGFVFQVVFLAILYPVSLGQTTYQQVSSLNWQPVPQFETLPFSVGYACVLLAASLAVWWRW